MSTDPRLIKFARQMRKEPSPAERKMWILLRDRRLAGFRFRRQHPIPPYIADYYCAVARLVVELDGESHVGSEDNDRVWQEFLEESGIRVVRFWNALVFDEPETVIGEVYRVCVDRVQANPVLAKMLTDEGHMSGPGSLRYRA